ncbi:MAG: RagB/SusD family nutrient uptake outer membrane protein [Cyclobacteriaceae bacterium]|nr:RagB/SusD family nutrient uptake outer membrane protein [Cyclobacteriaceae bacterium]MCH8517860.1 RagB/SusD family nutrient uptake outer membrane protein [Cyclobacteriaceae bacterium]
MKKIKYYIIILFTFYFSACSILDEQEALQELPFEEAYATSANIQSALVGAYARIQNGTSAAPMGADFTLYGDIIADNARFVGSFVTLQQINIHEMIPDNASIGGTWIESYRAINAVNIIIDRLDNFDPNDPNDDGSIADIVDEVKGQSLALRAILHFELVRLYGQRPINVDPNALGIPYIRRGALDLDQVENDTRNTVGEVYELIEEDLLEALDLIGGFSGPGRVDANVIRGYLMRHALMQNNYTQAEQYADAIINSGAYSLNDEVTDFFENELSGESIWEILHNPQDNPGVNDALTTFYNVNGRDDIRVTNSYIQSFEENILPAQRSSIEAVGDSIVILDDRRELLLLDLFNADGELTGTVTQKYNQPANNDDNAPIMRYADVLLVKAEMLVRNTQSVSQDAIDILNQLRSRALRVVEFNEIAEGEFSQTERTDLLDNLLYTTADFSSADDLLNAILLERRIELAFEGHRYHDLVRLGEDVLIASPSEDVFTPVGADGLAFPIPQREIDANPEMVQNLGY